MHIVFYFEWKTTFSRTFNITEGNDIGLLPYCWCHLFVCSGITSAVLMLSGHILVSMHWLMMRVIAFSILGKINFRNLVDNTPIPSLLLHFSCIIIFSTRVLSTDSKFKLLFLVGFCIIFVGCLGRCNNIWITIWPYICKIFIERICNL